MRLLLFFFLLPLTTLAQTASLVIVSEQDQKFVVYINDIQQNSTPVAAIRIGELNSPFYKVGIKFGDQQIKSLTKVVSMTDINEMLMDVIYHLNTEKPGKPKLQLYSMSSAGQAEIPAGTLLIKMISAGEFSTLKQTGLNAKGIEENAGKKNVPVKKCNGWPMAKEDFEKNKLTLKAVSPEVARIKTAKKLVTNNCLLVSQIIQLGELIPSETGRIEFVEYVYQYTLDRQNFPKVKNLFMDPQLCDRVDKLNYR